ncbi:GntR family transcriptional regulator [Alkalicoccus urumqiensis]|uniref:Transcriptional regulator n=1 Tax=Alkalicoccus urumqiensis TaxID=1548213 RepID=A0A2P6MLH9_ALKUR|nr:GntR family transcriptional regulator [Alkalicoccus urumqiensis]PRO67134.1 transcriptional regulator [Alkalicoccus urumqiensis]
MSEFAPRYQQIAREMKQRIEDGSWPEGTAVPTEAKLSEQYGASRVTVRQAVKLLVEEGLLRRVQGSGTYVQESKYEHNIYELVGFTEEMQKRNKTTSNKVLRFEVVEPDPFVAQRLGLDEGEKVYAILRQRSADDVPLIVEETYLPLRLFPDLTYQVAEDSKYAYIEGKLSLAIKESFQEVIPILPPEEIRELLGLEDAAQPILKVELSSKLADDTVFEYTNLYFKSDEYKFTITATRAR